jgi:macrolide-specific efflux system membrane fusion protein
VRIDLKSAVRRPWVVMPLVGLIGVGAWLSLRSESTSADTNTSAETTAEAGVGSMAQTVSAEGTLESAQTDDLSFGAAGTVTAVNVEAGDHVRAGRVLATMDSAELELAVANAESSLAEAQATLADDEDAGASEDQLEADRSALAAAQDSLDVARGDLDGARLVATFDGTVSAVNVVEGEQLTSGGTGGTSTTGSGSGSGGSASTLGSSQDTGLPPTTGDTGTETTSEEADIQVIDGDHFTVELGLDESDVDLVEIGLDATAMVTTSSSTGFPGGGAFPGGGVLPGGGAFPGAGGTTDTGDTGDAGDADGTTADASGPTAEGVVWEVGRIADASSGVASYPVTVLFENTDGEVNAGETVSVEITYDEVQDVVQVPTLAVTTEDDGSSTVTVRTDDGDETRTVETGLTSGTMTEITAGLEAGETVVMSFGGPGGTGGFPGGGDLPDDLPEGFPGAEG